MGALGISLIALIIILAGAVAGVVMRRVLPEQHLSNDTKDVVRLGTGLIGTLAALVLGLLIAAAASSFNAQEGHVQHIAADLILLDQLLEQYGPDAKPVREGLRQAVGPLVNQIWRQNVLNAPGKSPFETSSAGHDFVTVVLHLSPQNEAQRVIKDRAIQTTADLAQTRLLLFEQAGSAIPLPFLVILIFWLSIIFLSFGMFSHINPVLIGALIVFALSAAGALFLVLELNDPFSGLMQISSAPLRNALASL